MHKPRRFEKLELQCLWYQLYTHSTRTACFFTVTSGIQ